MKYTLASLLLFCVYQGFAQLNNAALQKQVMVSSEDKANLASYAVDGNLNTIWKSAKDAKTPHFIEIDLHKYHKVISVMVTVLKGEELQNSKDLKLQYWDDANWTDLSLQPTIDGPKSRLIYKIAPELTTFMVRINSNSAKGIAIRDIAVMGNLIENQPLPTVSTDINLLDTTTRHLKIKVTNQVVGKSMKYVGYNMGYYMPGGNVSSWVEYSQVNAFRVWANLGDYVPVNALKTATDVATLASFEQQKTLLRKNPEGNQFINWEMLNKKFFETPAGGNNAMNLQYVFTELGKMKIDIVLQASEKDFKDTWQDKWQKWQRYYALAYHAAKHGNVEMYAIQNEPNHKHSGPMKLDTYMIGVQIASDAVRCALEDVNKRYNKKLKSRFVAPVTAGNNTDWWAYVVKNIRKGYDGKELDYDLFDIFSTHSYNQPASGYATRVNDIRKVIEENHPLKKPLPIVFTEIGRWMNSILIDKYETYDSPSVFTEWAGIYANNMKNDAYGMWAFKFANTANTTLPEGIKSGHHLTWTGKRIVEDLYKNIALNAKVKASSANSTAALVTDGSKEDTSAWVSDSLSKQQWLEVDLGKNYNIASAIVYTGSSYGVFTGPDRVKNYVLQYQENNVWKDIQGTSIKDGKHVRFFLQFKKPILASKIRLVSTDPGKLRVREIKLFEETDGPAKEITGDYNVGGVHRVGEVVRLFAKGFKDERNLYQTQVDKLEARLDTYTSYDEKSGNYYMWLVQRGSFNYNFEIDVTALQIAAGTPITTEVVSEHYYGEVKDLTSLDASRKIKLTLPAQSVMLVTIPSAKILRQQMLVPIADATVSGGKNSAVNYGSDKELKISLDAQNPEYNKVSYLKFDVSKIDLSKSQKIILSVNGKSSADAIFRFHVYALPDISWEEDKINWKNAPLLDKREALITKVAEKAFVAGELAFSGIAANHYLDVTDVLKKHPGKTITFALVRESREMGDEVDKGKVVTIQSKETGLNPTLRVWQ
ncbi:MAG: discoidin domain-containing protein [Pedobacter sp.]|uniref:discoidin domain-containing protein n=1 Tax=Pedobacter sp. TaxID=1411316 RepID=UPI0028091DAD|nr:discoidin domain-containing protein [Pedobacter sp.]MDQ8005885.1 discoidin domain-containing protein [Pedobacter sp.]